MTEIAKYICIDKCPKHGYMAISIEDDRGGTRLTSSKCCGQWKTLHRWPVDESMVDNICTELGLKRAVAGGLALTETQR